MAAPQIYTSVYGNQRNTEIIKDNIGFLYYKNKQTETKMLVLIINVYNKLYLQCKVIIILFHV